MTSAPLSPERLNFPPRAPPRDWQLKQILMGLRADWAKSATENASIIHLCNNSGSWHVQYCLAGNANFVTIDLKSIAREISRHDSHAIILCHSHPGSGATPSQSDLCTTKSIQHICRALQVDLIDHIIFANTEDFSFRQAGLL